MWRTEQGVATPGLNYMNIWEESNMWKFQSASVLQLRFPSSHIIHTHTWNSKQLYLFSEHVNIYSHSKYNARKILYMLIFTILQILNFSSFQTQWCTSQQKRQRPTDLSGLQRKILKLWIQSRRRWAERRTVSVAPRLHFSHSDITVNIEHCPVFYLLRSWQCKNTWWSLHIETQK